MKPIRYFAALMMILTAVLHALPVFNVPQDANALPMLAFGIVYLSTAILLILDLKYSAVLGIVFPLIGLGVGVFVIGLNNVNLMLGSMFAIDVVVSICCIGLYMNRGSGSRRTG